MKFAIFLLGLLLTVTWAQDIIFPDDNASFSYNVSVVETITQRNSLKDQENCPENMQRHPDDGPKSTWICECKARFVHFPKTDSCHEAFSRGPCPLHHYVYLAPNDTTPGCVSNPCFSEGLAYFGGSCQRIGSIGGTCGNSVLDVNETTFQLECISPEIVPFHIIDVPKRSCLKGSRRNNLGVCKLII